MADTYEFVSMVRGYHEYQSIWSAVIREELPCRIELSNPHDLFAIAICKSDVVVGHVPRRISSICSSFLQRGGTIRARYQYQLFEDIYFQGRTKILENLEIFVPRKFLAIR